jgi:HSP20 family protein
MTSMTAPFGSVLTRVASLSRAMDDVFAPEFSTWMPALDAAESENAYIVTLDLPGIKREDIKINFDRGVLSVTGTRASEHAESQNGRVYVSERSYGSFRRSVQFARDIDADKIDAKLENGVLTISVPKAATALPRQIDVRIA